MVEEKHFNEDGITKSDNKIEVTIIKQTKEEKGKGKEMRIGFKNTTYIHRKQGKETKVKTNKHTTK